MPEEQSKNNEEQVSVQPSEPKRKPPVAGFNVNPENINKNGRPKNEVSITYWIKHYLETKEPGHEKTRAQELAEKIVSTAFKGNIKLMRDVTDRVDGKPTQPIKHQGEIDIGVGELTQTIQDMLKQSHEPTT